MNESGDATDLFESGNTKAVVLLADVLGMKQLMTTHSLESLAENVMNVLGASAAPPTRLEFTGATLEDFKKLGFVERQGPLSAFVSDGFLMVFPTAEDLFDLEFAMRRTIEIFATLLNICSANNIWLRGAITYGDCYLKNHGNGFVMLGHPIAEAFEWEKKQDWIGGILAPSAMGLLEHMSKMAKKSWSDPIFGPFGYGKIGESSAETSLLVNYEVPLKSNITHKTYAINLRCNVLYNIFAPHFRAPIESQSNEYDKSLKIKNTIRYLEFIDGIKR